MKTIERVPEATRAGGEPGAFFYVVNFNEGGYAVVPADGRATDVYALSDEGSFDPATPTRTTACACSWTWPRTTCNTRYP